MRYQIEGVCIGFETRIYVELRQGLLAHVLAGKYIKKITTCSTFCEA
jgi:hypothetical protein